MRTSKAAIFAANFAALYTSHQWADHAFQRAHDATHKQDTGPEGAKSCARHVASLVLATSAATLGVNTSLRTGVRTRSWLVAMTFNAATHYFADRGMQKGKPFRHVLDLTDSGGWVDNGGVVRREGEGTDLRGPGTAAYALDQAWHNLCLGIAAMITTVGSR
jgi:hypothetical protein